MLKINFVSHVKDITPEEKEYTKKRFEELSSICQKLSDSATQVHIEIKHSGTHDNWKEYECIAHITLPGHEIYAHDVGRSITEAVDLTQEKTKRQLEKAHPKKKHSELPEEDPKGDTGFDDLI